MLYKIPDPLDNQHYVHKQENDDNSYDKLYHKPETPSNISPVPTGMFSSSLPAMTSSPTSGSPSYQDQQAPGNQLGYPGSMYVPGSRSVLPSMQYLGNTNQTSTSSFWGMQPADLGYSSSANTGSQLSKPFSFDHAQSSTSPTSRGDGMAYPAPGTIARPNPYPSYMGTDISPWSMALQQGLHRIGSGTCTNDTWRLLFNCVCLFEKDNVLCSELHLSRTV